MKEITVNDCEELYDKFKKYCETAEQHQFTLLMMIDLRLKATIEHIQDNQKVTNQKDMRAMFRVVLHTIGEDNSQYSEENYK